MSWKKWNADTRGLFSQEASDAYPDRWSEMRTSDKNFSRFMFDLGWVNQRVSSAVRMEARNAFYNEFDIDPSDFDWTAWRLYMGYDSED